MTLTEIVADHPIETDCYTSLHYKLPLFVSAGGKTWEVDGERISIAKDPP